MLMKNEPLIQAFNKNALLPYELRLKDFEMAMQDVYDFRKNQRGELGTRTATLHRKGVEKLRQNWVYKEDLA